MSHQIKFIGCFFFSLLIIGSLRAAEQTQSEIPWNNLSLLQFDSEFLHQGQEASYTSEIKGAGTVLISSDAPQEITLKLLTGLGEDASALAVNFDYQADNGSAGTGSYELILASSEATVKDILQWTGMESKTDPSLEITLKRILSDDNADLLPSSHYVNYSEIKGTLFIKMFSKGIMTIRKYADLLIPANAMVCSMGNILNGKSNMLLNCSQMLINNLSQETWEVILQRGNQYLEISKIALPGASIHFKAQSMDQNDLASYLMLQPIRSAFEILYAENGLKIKKISNTIGSLDKIGELQCRAQFNTIIEEIVALRSSIDELVQDGGISEYDGTMMLDFVFPFARNLTVISTIAAPDYIIPDPPPESAVEWVVDQSVYTRTPDGSFDHPFPTIGQALDRAEDEGHTDVTLLIYGGVYITPLEITRNTFLYGIDGTNPVTFSTITCNHGVRFSIRNVDIRDASLPGAVTVNHPSARVSLNNVEIHNAAGYGIYQRRGEISLQDVTISNVTGIRGDYQSGAGAVFENDVNINAADVSIVNCDGSAMRISGSDTHLNARGLTIRGNFIDILEGTTEADFIIDEVSMEEGIFINSGAALEITDFARAHISNLRMSDNGFESILVTDNGYLNGTNVVIENTASTETAGIEGGTEDYGGLGVRVREHSHVILNDFTIRDNDMVGILISLTGGVDLHNGWVIYNPIGVHIKDPAYDTDRLRDNVRWDNDCADIDAAEVIVPEAGDPLGDL